jgi:hypothetical protein
MGPELLVALVSILGAAGSSLGVVEVVRAFVRRDASDQLGLAALNDADIDEALEAFRKELKPGGGSAPGLAKTPGELEMAAIMQVYGKELVAEAKRIAKRANAERPSKEHVRQAADRIGILRDRAGVASDLALAVGSILIGAAVSFQVNLWTGGDASDGVGLWMAIALAVGVGIVVAAGAIKWRRV